MAGAVHVEGEVTATFVISPLEGTGVVYTGTYREHAAGNFVTVEGEDVAYPAASFYLHGTGTGSDGSGSASPSMAIPPSISEPVRCGGDLHPHLRRELNIDEIDRTNTWRAYVRIPRPQSHSSGPWTAALAFASALAVGTPVPVAAADPTSQLSYRPGRLPCIRSRRGGHRR